MLHIWGSLCWWRSGKTLCGLGFPCTCLIVSFFNYLVLVGFYLQNPRKEGIAFMICEGTLIGGLLLSVLPTRYRPEWRMPASIHPVAILAALSTIFTIGFTFTEVCCFGFLDNGNGRQSFFQEKLDRFSYIALGLLIFSEIFVCFTTSTAKILGMADVQWNTFFIGKLAKTNN